MRTVEVSRKRGRSQRRPKAGLRRRAEVSFVQPEMRPVRDGQRAAAIMTAAGRRSVKFRVVRARCLHRLAHAAGMWSRGGYGQGHGSECAHEQKNQQKPGRQTMHKDSAEHPTTLRTIARRISQQRPGRKSACRFS